MKLGSRGWDIGCLEMIAFALSQPLSTRGSQSQYEDDPKVIFREELNLSTKNNLIELNNQLLAVT